jgi:hypothetical protein
LFSPTLCCQELPPDIAHCIEARKVPTPEVVMVEGKPVSKALFTSLQSLAQQMKETYIDVCAAMRRDADLQVCSCFIQMDELLDSVRREVRFDVGGIA